MRSVTVRRYGRGARWLHALVYTGVLTELVTGAWFVLIGYEAGFVVGLTDVHEYAGFALTAVVLGGIVVGIRGARTFLAESVRFRRSDLRWFRHWPAGLRTGRFAYHDGHFDPGQRLANLVMVVLLAILLASGVGAMYLPGPFGIAVFQAHRFAAYAITPVLLGHIVIAAGILPGYRGVWRSMHLGGRLPEEVAERIWPGWLAGYRAAGTDRSGGYAIGAGSAEPGTGRAPTPGLRTWRGLWRARSGSARKS
ncbi:MAG TPA: cytochrome b/b6 domain-containing protein [Actinophytocola sp.]|uniref:cytochrome b/b6 domain-containing protein n=1 Tax=Actinophytocola sp. TaxID=1872138 RepID=UPI002DBCBDDD|nr:cytochrome b/b6 domain-containing protein [Actinophytocola sp.]HEU5473102.1 cytochrome b/b6 domain-containing protein [Actinophytocola sp.]